MPDYTSGAKKLMLLQMINQQDKIMENIDSMARIEREIERRMEAACEKNGWYVANAQTKSKPYGII